MNAEDREEDRELVDYLWHWDNVSAEGEEQAEGPCPVCGTPTPVEYGFCAAHIDDYHECLACKEEYGGPHPDCRQCNGRGYVYDPRPVEEEETEEIPQENPI